MLPQDDEIMGLIRTAAGHAVSPNNFYDDFWKVQIDKLKIISRSQRFRLLSVLLLLRESLQH